MVLTPSRRCQHLKSSGQVPAEFPCLESIVWPPIAYWKHMISLTWSLTWRCSLKINTLGMCRLPVCVPCGVILALSGGSPHCIVRLLTYLHTGSYGIPPIPLPHIHTPTHTPAPGTSVHLPSDDSATAGTTGTKTDSDPVSPCWTVWDQERERIREEGRQERVSAS